MILDMRNICKDYPSASGTVKVLKNVSMQVEEGDYVAIMGPSGSGKTTLMNIIGFLDLPTSGTYLLSGRDETKSDDDTLAEVRNKHIGFVFQSFYLLPGLTAVENVALPLLYADVPLKERTERAAQALKRVGLEDRLSFYPNQLSGGQCQRVAIARAMVGKPELLLADEPTGALDTASGNQIMDIFRELNAEGMTIIMITHEQSVADCANRIYHILDGQIYENACAEEELEPPMIDYTANETPALLSADNTEERQEAFADIDDDADYIPDDARTDTDEWADDDNAPDDAVDSVDSEAFDVPEGDSDTDGEEDSDVQEGEE